MSLYNVPYKGSSEITSKEEARKQIEPVERLQYIGGKEYATRAVMLRDE
jgi:hypothetical protein